MASHNFFKKKPVTSTIPLRQGSFRPHRMLGDGFCMDCGASTIKDILESCPGVMGLRSWTFRRNRALKGKKS